MDGCDYFGYPDIDSKLCLDELAGMAAAKKDSAAK